MKRTVSDTPPLGRRTLDPVVLPLLLLLLLLDVDEGEGGDDDGVTNTTVGRVETVTVPTVKDTEMSPIGANAAWAHENS